MLKFGDLIRCGLDTINFWLSTARHLMHGISTVALDLKPLSVLDLPRTMQCSVLPEIWFGHFLLCCEFVVKISW